MKWKFDVYDEPEFIRVVTAGDFNAAGIAAMLDDLFALEDWHFGVPLLLDSRKLDSSRTDPLELLEASNNLIEMNPNLAFTKVAVLLRSQESLERAKRIEQSTFPGLTADIRLFLDAKEALNWLLPNFSGKIPSNNG
jgi:hypothetical protein